MEVHQHSHTERKKWSHYLWEFFMLFMAVTLGFFVENQREHYVERNRGLQYIRSFVEDLVQDTSNFSMLLTNYKEKASVLDNMLTCYDTVTGNLHSNECLLKIMDYAGGFPDMVYTDRTLQQLKNAGGLRLLSIADADSITFYDNSLRSMEKNETTELQETQTLIRSIAYELFNFSVARERMKDKPVTNNMSLLFGNNKTLLNKYFNVLFHYTWLIHGQVFLIERLIGKASSLISYFKKEHHLE
jgi:hypothetical protein